MAGNRKVISFFLASPGDLIAERKIAKQVADELNSMLSLKFNVHIELVGWEDTVSSAGRPQEIINRDLNRCDVFLGILWKRWGSAPDNESRYESGFEEEFTIATTSHAKIKKPLISLFFKKIDATALSDPGEQLQRVIKFKKQVIEDKALLFQEFEGNEGFSSILRKCMSTYVLEHVDLSETKPQATHTPDAGAESTSAEQVEDRFDFSPISGKSASFIQAILRRGGDEKKRAKLEPFEVARLRLISNSLGYGQNDKAYLGAHDANLIYRNKERFSFEWHERFGLIQCAVKSIPHENIPLWYWLQHQESKSFSLSILTFIMDESEHAIITSILDLMTITGTEIKPDEMFSRRDYIASYLAEERHSSIRNAALRYLAEKGVEGDLEDIRREIEKNSSQTIALAHEAFISVKMREGLNAGLQAVNDLQPTTLSMELIEELFRDSGHIPTQVLYKTLENRNKVVRQKAIEILNSRENLSLDLIENIRQDPEPNVRCLAIPALLKLGNHLGEDEAKSIIMKDASKPTEEETLIWSEMQPHILALVSTAELERRANRHLPLVHEAYFELSRRMLDKKRAELTKNLINKYEDFYRASLNLWAETNNDDTETVLKQFENLKGYIINVLTRRSLTLLVERKSKKDLSVIRSSLIDPLISPLEIDLEYLNAHGEWQDVPLIIELVRKFGAAPKRSLLEIVIVSKSVYVLAVKTILRLGRDRLADVLSLDCPGTLKGYIISSIRDSDFVKIGDDVILDILKSNDAEIRKHCSLKCCKAYKRERLIALLEKYNQVGQTFYNVVHWIDFGIYASRDQVRNVCKKIFIC